MAKEPTAEELEAQAMEDSYKDDNPTVSHASNSEETDLSQDEENGNNVKDDDDEGEDESALESGDTVHTSESGPGEEEEEDELDSEKDKSTGEDAGAGKLEEGDAAAAASQAEEEAAVKLLEKKYGQELTSLKATVIGLQGFVQKLTKETKGAKVESPSQEQVQKALEDSESFAKLKADFPDWGLAIDSQMGVYEQRILKKLQDDGLINDGQERLTAEQVNNIVSKSSDFQAMREEIIDLRISKKHEDWQQTAKSKPFNEWFGKQPEEIQVLASSENPADVILVFDKYNEHKIQSQKDTDQDERLEESIAPTTGNKRKAPGSKAISEAEAMEQGYNSA